MLARTDGEHMLKSCVVYYCPVLLYDVAWFCRISITAHVSLRTLDVNLHSRQWIADCNRHLKFCVALTHESRSVAHRIEDSLLISGIGVL